MKNELFLFDQKLRLSYPQILGIDEVGRGCGAGPLVVCGVILDPIFFDVRIRDSKTIKSIALRKVLKNLIIKNSYFFKIKIISSKIVDQIGPKSASVMGMKKIVNNLISHFDLCLTDYEKISGLQKPQINLVSGDKLSFSIACASIVAKSTRDDLMEKLSHQYPQYEFNKNQGYLTKKHLEILKTHPPLKNIHRFSYKPIKLILEKK